MLTNRKMKAIEYNGWKSFIEFISTNLPSVASDYGLSGTSVDILPAYPKDLTKFKKPSIIIQKIHTSQSPVGFGSVLGQIVDSETGIAYDVSGRIHDILYQINFDCKSNTECSLLTSAVMEGLLENTQIAGEDHLDIPFYDYLLEVKAEVGSMDIAGKVEVTPMASGENDDYINILRLTLRTIQSIIHDTDDIVDLAKPFSYVQHITL